MSQEYQFADDDELKKRFNDKPRARVRLLGMKKVANSV